MEGPQVKLEPGAAAPKVGTELDNGAFAQELHDLGLLDFVQDIGFTRFGEGAGGLPPSARHPSGHVGPVVGHNNPPPQPTDTLEIQQCQQTNQATDFAAARAMQVLASARLQLNNLQQNSYTPRPTGSVATDGSGSKRRKTSRGADASGSRGGSKGLRHFSMKVCEKVEAKGRTTYNEVADELVGEMSKMEAMNKNGQYDEKNIRRRVYDAINVLMAMDIIQKEKKEILWRGFPRLTCNSADRVKAERAAKIKEVEQKQLYLQDMIEQQKALKKLLERSAARQSSNGGASTSETKLFLPFILVQAKPDATVEVKISDDMMDVQFDFYHSPFQIHDDSHVLKKMAEHQARLPPPPQQLPNQPPTVSGLPPQFPPGLGLPPFMPPPLTNGGLPGNLLGGMQSAMADPALAKLAATAQAQGNPLPFGFAPPLYTHPSGQHQQQQQQMQQQHQLMQQPAGGDGGASRPSGSQGGAPSAPGQHGAGGAVPGLGGGGPAQLLQALQAHQGPLLGRRSSGGAAGGTAGSVTGPGGMPQLPGLAGLSAAAAAPAGPSAALGSASGSGQLLAPQLSGQLSGSLPVAPVLAPPPLLGGLPSLPHAPPLNPGALPLPPGLASALAAPPPLTMASGPQGPSQQASAFPLTV
ncbi:hypothetical protein HYH02_004990 [Chlamydomonas schloesseri]|uniref:Uncharacterized protein n=1 Tax=Chlamydomonas schloesseri TaxID=2026947 RepID=A0A836B8M4_9CHLO|nr:hypothetical protein HYH02_004990 [Chlamydomonas schloesseri]|eukprot:KAG2450489.1 hypothetical protein HYH02_004990 [Chlamydomonas schloesseri]